LSSTQEGRFFAAGVNCPIIQLTSDRRKYFPHEKFVILQSIERIGAFLNSLAQVAREHDLTLNF
jgi:transposase-like protein